MRIGTIDTDAGPRDIIYEPGRPLIVGDTEDPTGPAPIDRIDAVQITLQQWGEQYVILGTARSWNLRLSRSARMTALNKGWM